VASTGIALLKGVDPNLETPVAEEMVLGSGTALTIALPLFAVLFIPSLTYDLPNKVFWNWMALLGCLVYVLVLASILLVQCKRNKNST